MEPEIIVGGFLLAALVLYALTGGADYGGGVWDLLATGRTRARQRALIEQAIGPIWEANHVWLILVVTVLFTCFPRAFAVIATALHVPIALLLLGIVLRGATFTFRAYDSRKDVVQRRWGAVFSGASVVTPVLLGMIVGALASGEIGVRDGVAAGGWIAPWAKRWPLLCGFFTLACFSYLAAVYLCVEAREQTLKEGETPLTRPFRARALASWLAVTLLASFLFFEARLHAPHIAAGLTARWFSWPLLLATGACSLLALHSLIVGRFRWARFFAAAQVALIVIGWGASQYPWLVVPDVTIWNAAAPPRMFTLVVWALVIGSALLLPSLWYLYRTFKREHPFSPIDPPR